MCTGEFGHHSNMRYEGSRVPGSLPKSTLCGVGRAPHACDIVTPHHQCFSDSTMSCAGLHSRDCLHFCRVFCVQYQLCPFPSCVKERMKGQENGLLSKSGPFRDRTERSQPGSLPGSFLPFVLFPSPRSPKNNDGVQPHLRTSRQRSV